MKPLFDKYTIYDFGDEMIVHEICRKVKALRRSCCVSQEEFARQSGVSIASIKRIEAGRVSDINICTLIKIMRSCGVLEGFADLLPDTPESPFLTDSKSGLKKKNCRAVYKMISL